MAKTNDELLAIRDESYRVIHAEVCKTCNHWHRLRTSDNGLCFLATSRNTLTPKPASWIGTCDLWEGKQRDQ